MTNLDRTSDNVRKCLRPSQILKSNKIVCSIINCLETQFISPFSEDFDQQRLYNLVSGEPVSKSIAESMTMIEEMGQSLVTNFHERMVSDKAGAFFDPIKKNKVMTFASSEKKSVLKSASYEEVRIEKDVLGTLLADSTKTGGVIDIDKVLTYPLSPLCAPLSTADGNRRKTKKSDLLSIIDPLEVNPEETRMMCETYMLDLAVYTRSDIKQCSTVRDITLKLIRSVPLTYDTLYVVCDKYEETSIKTGERQSRNKDGGEIVILKSPDMKVPFDIKSFMSVGQNKEDLFNLIKRAIIEIETHLKIFFCFRETFEITNGLELDRTDLQCDHEEADTMLVAFAYQTSSPGIMVRSPSGDVDIVSLFLYHDMFIDADVFIDNGTGAQRKMIDIYSTELSLDKREAILGLLGFTGNDYLSSFFWKYG